MEITASMSSAPLEPLSLQTMAPTSAPDTAAAQQFAALMQAPASESLTSAAGPANATVTASAGPTSFGDRILHGMQHVSTEFRDTWTRVSNTLQPDSPALGMQEMLGLQLHMTQAAVQIDLLGKAVSRSTQNVDQLVRVQ